MELHFEELLRVTVVVPANDSGIVRTKLESLGWKIVGATRNPVPGTGQFDMTKFRFVALHAAEPDAEKLLRKVLK
jgi:hypothetical protein